MHEFKIFLKSRRKKNGDRFLSSTIERYLYFYKKYEYIINKYKDDHKKLIKVFNSEIKRTNNIVLYSMIKNYFIFLNYNPKTKDSLINKLETPESNLSYVKSKRFLQSKVLSVRELSYIMNNINNLKDKIIISWLYDTACRRNELLNIRYSDIEFMSFNDDKQKNERKKGIYAKISILGKGHKRREVYIGKLSMSLLYRFTSGKYKSSDKVFILKKSNGELYKNQEQSLYDLIKKIGKNTINRELHPHMFRHTKLTHMADNGCGILGIKAYGGHEDIRTSQIYVEISTYVGKLSFSQYSEDILTV